LDYNLASNCSGITFPSASLRPLLLKRNNKHHIKLRHPWAGSVNGWLPPISIASRSDLYPRIFIWIIGEDRHLPPKKAPLKMLIIPQNPRLLGNAKCSPLGVGKKNPLKVGVIFWDFLSGGAKSSRLRGAEAKSSENARDFLMPYKTASLTTAAVHSRLESPAPRIQNFKFVYGNRVRVCVSCVRAGWPAGPLFRALDIAQKLISSERKLSHVFAAHPLPFRVNYVRVMLGAVYSTEDNLRENCQPRRSVFHAERWKLCKLL